MPDWKTKVVIDDEPDFGKKYNPNERYETPMLSYDERDKVILRALRKAIQNGWKGWRTMVNDAVTLGMEAEAVLKDMKRFNKPIEPLIYNQEFARFLWGEEEKHARNQAFDVIDKHGWKHYLQEMVISHDPIIYLGQNT